MNRRRVSAVGLRRRISPSSGGFATIWVAILLFFLMGAAALAVDSSEFWQQARSEQKAADLACLAGAQELPGSSSLAIQKAAEFLRPNHRGLATLDPLSPTATTPPTATSGIVSDWTVPPGFSVEIETPVEYDGTLSPSVMRVTISQIRGTRFGKAIGVNSATIVQEAYCGAFTQVAAGILPVGVGVNFQGGVIKFNESECSDEATTKSGSGVCNWLSIPRNDGNGGGGTNELAWNILLGSDWPLAANLGPHVRCTDSDGSPGQPCDQLVSKSGDPSSAIYNGLIGGFPNQDYLGRLAFSSSAIATPKNPHELPPSFWTAQTDPPGPPGSYIEWNTNLLHNTTTYNCTKPTPDLHWFDQAQFPTGSPSDPTDDCTDEDIDDQSDYPITPTSDFVPPPEFEISKFDCRDLRLTVVPAGDWGPKGGGAGANARLFTIKGFELVYLLDPIVEDDFSPSPDRVGLLSSGDYRLLWWNHKNNNGGVWKSDDRKTSNINQLSAFSVKFIDSNGDGKPDPEIVGDCPAHPFPPGLDDILPKEISLVQAP